MERVNLTDEELFQAALIGVQIQTYNVRSDVAAKHRHGSNPGYAWQYSIMGAIGEKAVSKYLGVYWSGNVGNYGAKDVAGYQVRATTLGARWGMILHPQVRPGGKGDHDADVFIAAHIDTSTYKTVHLLGWCYGRQGKRQSFWRDDTTIVKPPRKGGDAFFVPRDILQSMHTLPTIGETK